MDTPIGKRRWAIAEGYIPPESHGPEPQMTSHETACLLNTSNEDATVQITIFFSDCAPVGPYYVKVPAPTHAAYALQRLKRSGIDSARYRLRESN